MNQNYKKLLLLGLWITGVMILLVYYLNSDLTLAAIQSHFKNYLQKRHVFAPLAYILIYIIRPLIFFPATLLTTISGALFGPVWGIIYTIVGENLSANVSYLVGRFFGKNIIDDLIVKNKVIPLLDKRIVESQFMSILIMRLLYMPFDMVGFMAGFRQLRQLDYALGTFLGIIPGLVTFVLLGSSITDPKNIVFTGIAFILGIGISFFLKKRTFMSITKNNGISMPNKPEEKAI